MKTSTELSSAPSPLRRAALPAAAVLLVTTGAVAGGYLLVPVAGARVALPVDTTVRLSCGRDGRSSIEHCTGSACAPVANVSCGYYGCDPAAGLCRARCASDSDCASRARCNVATGQCVQPHATCRDAFTTIAASGIEPSCAPYKCRAGACRGECNDTSDCASGYECRGQKCTPIGG